MPAPERHARLVLVNRAGALLGSLAPFPVEIPWWQYVAPVVRAARERHGIEVTVLRLLEAERTSPPGGVVTYLAQVEGSVSGLEPWPGRLDEHPLRMPWARPGGPEGDLAWADAALAQHGLERTGAAQVRTWNLSSLWRLEADARVLWLKVVPPFFAHEGELLARLAGQPVPCLLASEHGRMLLEELPGEDLHDPAPPLLPRMVSLAVALQHAWLGRSEELLALGAADFRAPALTLAIEQVVERTVHELSRDDRHAVVRFVATLPERMAAVAACGLPDTVVHGDLHPGNFRGDGRNALALLDWGDSGAGHPLLDQPAFLERVPAAALASLREHWNRAWRTRLAGCDPERAAHLLAPVAAARQAVIYLRFLDRIEPAEHPYHRADPAAWLVRTAALTRPPH